MKIVKKSFQGDYPKAAVVCDPPLVNLNQTTLILNLCESVYRKLDDHFNLS